MFFVCRIVFIQVSVVVLDPNYTTFVAKRLFTERFAFNTQHIEKVKSSEHGNGNGNNTARSCRRGYSA